MPWKAETPKTRTPTYQKFLTYPHGIFATTTPQQDHNPAAIPACPGRHRKYLSLRYHLLTVKRTKNGDPCGPPFVRLERVMGIEPQHPLSFPINRLPHRTGLQNGSQIGSLGSGKRSAHTVSASIRKSDVVQTNRGPFGVGSSGPCIDCVWLGGLRLCSSACCWLIAATFSLLCNSFCPASWPTSPTAVFAHGAEKAVRRTRVGRISEASCAFFKALGIVWVQSA